NRLSITDTTGAKSEGKPSRITPMWNWIIDRGKSIHNAPNLEEEATTLPATPEGEERGGVSSAMDLN
ncbi:hypothetical protein A2U01_0056768, partial [Trifolium medium]|nr:hypothetical protein [Trifolium medium]